MMHVPINVKSPNNISKWQTGFNSAFKGLKRPENGKKERNFISAICFHNSPTLSCPVSSCARVTYTDICHVLEKTLPPVFVGFVPQQWTWPCRAVSKMASRGNNGRLFRPVYWGLQHNTIVLVQYDTKLGFM
jgi:hypothetical protein